MSFSFRITESEAECLSVLSMKINKTLIERGYLPVSISKLTHLALAQGIEILEHEPELLCDQLDEAS